MDNHDIMKTGPWKGHKLGSLSFIGFIVKPPLLLSVNQYPNQVLPDPTKGSLDHFKGVNFILSTLVPKVMAAFC